MGDYRETLQKELCGRPSLGSDEGISRGFDLYDTYFVVWPLRVELTWLRSLGGPWFARPNF